MELIKRDGKWWIAGADPYYIDDEGPFTSYGPYDTKSQAMDDLRGIRRFEKLIQEECPTPQPMVSSVPPERDAVRDDALAQPVAG